MRSVPGERKLIRPELLSNRLYQEVNMSRNRTALASAIVALSLGASAVVPAAGSMAATTHRGSAGRAQAHVAARGARIGLRRTRLGRLLVNSRGFTLYAFSKDPARKDTCVAKRGCTSLWPLVTTHGAPRAGHGVKRSLLGTIKVRGRAQVTYAGHPLYTYSGDGSRGSTSYVGVRQFGGVWRGLRASGRLVS
jgi:predicted lipoprotein with Yx(FWY)xxD motif